MILNKEVGRGFGVHGLCWGLTLTWRCSERQKGEWDKLGPLRVNQVVHLRSSASIGASCNVESRPWDEIQKEEGQLTTFLLIQCR